MSNNQDLDHARRVLEVESQCILAARDRLDERFSQAVDLVAKTITRGGKAIVTGVGKSGKIAAKVSATLSSTGTPSVFLHPTEGLHGDMGVVSARDVLIVFSYSGNSAEVLRLLPHLKVRGAAVISILGNLKSEIAAHSDVVLDGSVAREACPLNLAPTSSTAVALALGDALAMALSVRLDFKEEQFADNHPGGALGRRLTLRVSDLMRASEEMPWIEESAGAREVVESVTSKNLGAVLVRAAPRKLAGIITDGDIRRALGRGSAFFTLKARDIMTRDPVTIRSDERAIKALELMENRPSQINVLPVVNATGDCIGLVRVHDLIGTL
ncbi:MAG: KpsF/GutQ family sugar-phosphate isomerase [Deltaproteobacteria bacterium]|nr:KpsF/GutQ family sugar-phosphate isomerase [Deltaproteobacteria bacterium]